MDLSQAKAARRIALNQMRGGFSNHLKELRKQLLNFTSLIELELDFGDEDVEFADRHQLELLLNDIHKVTSKLLDSFQLGNVIKQGIPVTIAGKPNVGKSTLLYHLEILIEILFIKTVSPSALPNLLQDFISFILLAVWYKKARNEPSFLIYFYFSFNYLYNIWNIIRKII